MLNTGEFILLTIILTIVFTLRGLPRLGDNLAHLLSGRSMRRK